MEKEKVLKRSVMACMLLLLTISWQSFICNAQNVLEAPAGVRVWRHSNTSLRIKWDKNKKSDGYIIYKYNKNQSKYIKYKMIKDRDTTIFIDEVGNRKSAKYKVCAYKKSGNKKIISKKSYWVRARTYKQGDKKVNPGKVSNKISSKTTLGGYISYYETLQLSAKVKPSNYSTAKGKKAFSEKVRWYTSNAKVATVDKNGLVSANTQKGKCYIYARAQNGRRSKRIMVCVENYAKPKKNSLDLDAAYDNIEKYGFVLELFTRNYKVTTDIAEYFYINQPVGNETFQCWMEQGEVKMSPENYVTGEMKQTIYNFIKNFPYDMRLDVDSNIVKFTELYGLNEEYRYAGPKVVFKYDQNKTDPSSYNTKYTMATHWVYGSFAGI